MRIETLLFGGVALFFGGTAAGYAWWSGREPAGTAALIVAFLMTSLITLFFHIQYKRHGRRPEDRAKAEVRQRSGPLDFFPPHSPYPPLTAAGVTVCALGVVYGLWLFLIGTGLLAAGIAGFTFQYAHRED